MTSGSTSKEGLKEALGVWTLSLVLIGLLGLAGLFLPILSENLLACVAAVFLYLPAWALWRKQRDLVHYGFRAEPIGRGLLLTGAVVLVVLPPFYVGHHYWQAWVLDQSPVHSPTTFHRFDQELEGRPELPAEANTLHLWVESDDLRMLWTGTTPITVQVEVESAGPTREGPHKIEGIRQTEKGLLVHAPVNNLRTVNRNVFEWTPDAEAGLGVDIREVSSFTIECEGTPFRTGRYGVLSDSPLEQKRSLWWVLLLFGSQLILVAIPEEWFYRGYLQERLDETMGRQWSILGTRLGWGWLLSSVLFALGHLVLDPRPTRLAVFFPSLLFGWMRARTGSILAPALFHAISNVWIQSLGYVYVGLGST